jgi:hypothetical protein
LRYFNTTIEEAKTAFKRLHASDPALNTHVNVRGQTSLSELVRHGGWGDYGRQTENQLEIIRFLVEELGVRNGMETPQYVSLTGFPAERRGNQLTIARFLYKIAEFGDNQHLEAIDFFLRIGHDFENCDDPRFELWPELAVSLLAPPERYGGYIMPEVDPFYVSRLTAKGKHLQTTNFLGQTAVHMALHPSRTNALKVLLDKAPELKDQHDRWGFPPLMYAAAMGYQDAAASLIQNNANLTVPTDENILGIHLPDYGDFIGCCLASGHSGVIWELYDDLLANAACSGYPLWPRLSALLETLQAPENDKEQRDWEQIFGT